MTSSSSDSTSKFSFLRDERFWKLAFQVITLAVVGVVLYVLATNLSRNMARQGIDFGFSFLQNASGFAVGESLVNLQRQDPYFKVLLAGFVNSVRAIAVAIVLTTIVGILAGVASFSDNWLVYKISRAYVGLIRNIPLLLQLFFWYFAVFSQVPTPDQQFNLLGTVIANKRGLYLPGPSFSDSNWLGLVMLVLSLLLGGLLWKLVSDVLNPPPGTSGTIRRIISGALALAIGAAELFLIFRGLVYLADGEAEGFNLSYGAWVPVMIVAAIVLVLLWRWRTKTIVEQGISNQSKMLRLGMGAMAIAILLMLVFGLGWQTPVAQDGGGATGGLRLSVEYAAAVTALVFYTGAFIAEIVRGGIQSVSKGQWEAARSLGLPSDLAMRLVVFPQALRVIIPPLNSEYMNLTKNSSLAFAIGYPDLYAISNTTYNQTGKPVEIFIVLIGTYLLLCLLISVSMNQLNNSVQLQER
ncbi:MAG: amino acid ABC transporter permease [Elainellaceae cyanobacterium]